MSTDSRVLVNNAIGGNPITYEKKPVEKKFINTKDLYKADLMSFDTKIGFITNCSTTLYAMLPMYKEGTKEYNEILTRLKLCRKEQGNQIDSAKGLIIKPFPKHWINWQNPEKEVEGLTKEEIEFNNSILIEKRPYFMKYLYSNYKNEFKKHYNKYDYLCYRQFGIHIDELFQLKNTTEEQKILINNYNKFNPLLDSDCAMNNICKHMEEEIKEIKFNVKKPSPDYIFDILYNKDIEITDEQIEQMERVYKLYKKSKSNNENLPEEDNEESKTVLIKNKTVLDFDYISDDIQKLANLAIYVNYYLHPKSPKNFCWEIFGDGIILNLLDKTNGEFYIPLLNRQGDIQYMGKKYKNERMEINNDNF